MKRCKPLLLVNNMLAMGVWALLSMMGLFGCKQSEVAETLIAFDPKANYPEKELVVQDFMDVEYIPLETNEEFITQGSVKAIGERYLLVTNYINDGNIFVFDRKTGKAIRKINRKGQGAEEYAFINGIILDEENGEMFVNSAASKKIFVYDLQGNFKRSFPHAEGAQYMEVFDYDKDNLICYDMTNCYKDEEKRDKAFYHALISKQDGSVTQGIPLPFDLIKAPFVREGEAVAVAQARAIAPGRGDWLLADTSTDTVYRYTSTNKLTPFLVKKPAENPEMFLVMGVCTDRFYFMKTIEKKFNFEKMRGFPSSEWMYDKQEKAFFKPVLLNADQTTRQWIDMVDRLVDGKVAAYQELTAESLVEAYQKNELKGELKEIAAGLDEESNPVLMLVKHRK